MRTTRELITEPGEVSMVRPTSLVLYCVEDGVAHPKSSNAESRTAVMRAKLSIQSFARISDVHIYVCDATAPASAADGSLSAGGAGLPEEVGVIGWVDAGGSNMPTIERGSTQRQCVAVAAARTGSLQRRPLMLAVVLLVAAPAVGRADTAGDRRDQPYLSTIVNRALETERTNTDIPWSNPETGHRGVLVIERTWYRDPQSPCRDYRWTLERNGRPAELINGTGCRIGPAVWRLDERPAASPLRTPDPSAPLPVPSRAPSTSTPSVPDPSAPDTTAPAPAPQTATPPQATRSAKASPRRKPSAPASKSQAAAAGDATAPKPAALPSYTLPSKTAL